MWKRFVRRFGSTAGVLSEKAALPPSIRRGAAGPPVPASPVRKIASSRDRTIPGFCPAAFPPTIKGTCQLSTPSRPPPTSSSTAHPRASSASRRSSALATRASRGCRSRCKILLENLLRHEDGQFVQRGRHRARWPTGTRPPACARRSRSRRRGSCSRTSPACRASSIWRPCATRSSASAAIRRASTRCSPSSSSSTTPSRSTPTAGRTRFELNADLEFTRNRERYVFLRWGQDAFANFRVVPPDTGIVHQVNLEYLARVVFDETTRRHDGGVPRHAGRHRLAHDDGERAGRGGLGRGRDRGRGVHARPAHLDAGARRARREADRPPARAAPRRPTSC